MIANNRTHMGKLLEDRMSRAEVSARIDGRQRRDAYQVKTYLIEALLPEEATTKETVKFIEELFPRFKGGDGMGSVTLAYAKDDTVVSVHAAFAGESVYG